MNLEVDPRRPEGERRVLAFARRLLPSGRAADFNQALMDLGSSVCVAGQPRCGVCPLRMGCAARRAGVERQRPVRARTRAVPQRIATAGVLRRRGRVLIARRPPGRLLGGLWEFPGGKRRSRETIRACLRRELREELGVRVEVGESLGTIRHTYSHFSVTVHAFECRLDGGEPAAREHRAIRWVTPSRLGVYPMGKVARTIARKLVSATQTEMGHRSPRTRREKPSGVVQRRGSR